MNSRDFFNLVAEMRKTQKEYFNSRSPFALERSMKLEKQVDNEIKRVAEVLKRREFETKQQTLFTK